MQLFLNATSPFARVARVCAIEKNFATRLRLTWVDPWCNAPALLAVHPQGRIPVLLTEDGQAISESLLIALYLDQHGDGPQLVPATLSSRILARTSLAYGLMEAAFHTVIARKHEGVQADATVMGQRRLAALDRALQQLEAVPPQQAPDHTAPITLDSITTAVALAYVVFRLPNLLSDTRYPQLMQWLHRVQERPSLASTAFTPIA